MPFVIRIARRHRELKRAEQQRASAGFIGGFRREPRVLEPPAREKDAAARVDTPDDAPADSYVAYRSHVKLDDLVVPFVNPQPPCEILHPWSLARRDACIRTRLEVCDQHLLAVDRFAAAEGCPEHRERVVQHRVAIAL